MRVAFDMASFCWRALNAGKDDEFGLLVEHDGRTVQVNSAQYGYDLVIGLMVQAMRAADAVPRECILVFEGMHSKRRRLAIDPSYKAQRESRPPQAYEQYQKLQAMLEEAWKNLGAIAMSQDFVEGDDVLAFLAHHTEDPLMVASYDGDMVALNGVNNYGAEVMTWVDGKIAFNKYGDFDYRLVTLYKALVGDTNDNIKGCPSFGQAAWNTLRAEYGDEGLFEIANALDAGGLGDLHAQRDESKPLRKICDNEAQVLRCWQLAKTHPEWVNTRMQALSVRPGMCKPGVEVDPRLREWAGQAWLVTANDFEDMAVFCRQQFKESPFVALDIETSTPDESDEWLANQVPPNPDGVDVLGSELTGLSLTFGRNLQYTVYISVDHAETLNVPSEQVRQLVADVPCNLVIQNLAFELPVLYQAWAADQLDNGYEGFLPRCLDTKLEASYVDENVPRGLKQRSKMHLGYTQTEYKETVTRSGPVGTLRKGGRQTKTYVREAVPARYWRDRVEISEEEALKLDAEGATVEVEDAVTERWEDRMYKMRELPAAEVFDYGADDTTCTAALHNFYELMMKLEHHWQTYLDVEIGAAYLNSVAFLQGCNFSAAKMRELVEDDDKTYDEAWTILRSYLISKGWPGTVCPVFDISSKAADFKLAYELVAGEPLDTMVRMPEKLAKLMIDKGQEALGELLLRCYKLPSTGEGGGMTAPWVAFNDYVKRHFKGEPEFNIGSPKQKQRVMYELMGLPVRLRNDPTDQMRSAGIREGGPKTSALAIDWAVAFDAKEEDKPVLQALKLMQMVETRRNLFYAKWPGFVHWKTGRVHSSINQCEANTRRSSESSPNKQQLGKRQGPDGKTPRFRETIVPHHENAVIVSLDEASQELRILADYCKDEAMLSCFIGENKRDMHHLTGLGIAQHRFPDRAWSYDVFHKAYKSHDHEWHGDVTPCRMLGKTTNFSAVYGVMAKTLGERMIVPEEDAQTFLDARSRAFPGEAPWKESVIEEARNTGIVRTMCGAVRHLRDAFNSNDSYEASKAERQGPSFKIQSSAAEMIKKAMGTIWESRVLFRLDCEFIGSVHDEVVFSVGIPDLYEFLQVAHGAMTQPYGGMTVPIESSISFGPSFGVDDQVEIGSWPTAEAIQAGLDELAARKARRSQRQCSSTSH